MLYVEEGDTKDKMENFQWHKEFNKAFDHIYVAVNDPRELHDWDQTTFKHKVQIKRSQTL